MAKRLATCYKEFCFTLNQQQLQSFICKFNKFPSQTKVLDNGDTELILQDEENQIPLSFRHEGNQYECRGTYMIQNLELANIIRRAIQDFKGSAIVHRIYEQYTMEYHYLRGEVMEIHEIKKGEKFLIYKHKDAIGALTQLFHQRGVEEEIEQIKKEIDYFLEARLFAKTNEVLNIDVQLRKLIYELFIREA